MKASISTPSAIATASSRNWSSGITASTAKLAASASPAVVMARDARGAAAATARGAAAARLLEDPAHDDARGQQVAGREQRARNSASRTRVTDQHGQRDLGPCRQSWHPDRLGSSARSPRRPRTGRRSFPPTRAMAGSAPAAMPARAARRAQDHDATAHQDLARRPIAAALLDRALALADAAGGIATTAGSCVGQLPCDSRSRHGPAPPPFRALAAYYLPFRATDASSSLSARPPRSHVAAAATAAPCATRPATGGPPSRT